MCTPQSPNQRQLLFHWQHFMLFFLDLHWTFFHGVPAFCWHHLYLIIDCPSGCPAYVLFISNPLWPSEMLKWKFQVVFSFSGFMFLDHTSVKYVIFSPPFDAAVDHLQPSVTYCNFFKWTIQNHCFHYEQSKPHLLLIWKLLCLFPFPVRWPVHSEADAPTGGPILPRLCSSLLHLHHWGCAAEGLHLKHMFLFWVWVNNCQLSATAADGAGKDPGRVQDWLQELPEQHGEETGPAGHGKSLLWKKDGSGETHSLHNMSWPMYE